MRKSLLESAGKASSSARLLTSIAAAATFFVTTATVAAWPGTAVPGTPVCLRMAIVPDVPLDHPTISNARSAFKVAGVCTETIPMPVRRSEQLIHTGGLDGDFLRTKLWAEMHADEVLLVPTPVAVDQMVVISLIKKRAEFPQMASLSGHMVAISAGHRWAEQKLAEVNAKAIGTNSAFKILELVRHGRVDAGLVEASLLPPENERTDIRIDPVSKISYHIVLLKKHVKMLPALNAALIKSGTLSY
ncbi:MAG: hypothetical protein JKY60_16855 [Kordiimonadaceae bacterium]|nr:hypothetical protein [Kordiimonadaceae bacterium]